MSATTRRSRSPRGAAPRRSVIMRAADRPPPEPEALLTDGQRRMILALTAAGLACIAVGLVVPPRGALFWLMLALLPGLAGIAAFVMGGARGRAVDTWLLGGGGPKVAFQPPAPAALPDATRAALGIALLPGLLAELARRAADMQESQKAAAEALLVAASGGPEAARQDLAAALPRLIAGLAAGDAAATAEAGRLAALFARPAATAGGRA
ncbi:hypothetical protein J5Y09_21275 [Roseomonas sp. PWR1]|uniref:Uncharacterized protein n=1 Tax=Roseomonas nitratireducens TaxID=2820810 RepID=A0ABS4AYM7_9PROT|nr:hypothetical protein [Neoroseomonas nitratireducens]MBP0466474.1 hypothetical protein [Neoroseomonas nitratireducens]